MTTSQPECPICGDASRKTVRCPTALKREAVFNLTECPGCGASYFEPMPSAEQLADFYSGSYYDFDRHSQEGKGMAFARDLTRWRQSGRFLDVGCATGFFINGIRRHSDWDVYGTDFGGDAVRFASDELGLDVREGELVDAGFDDAYFDYIHVNNVLEHVRDPVGLLRECRRIIKADGRMYLSVPNGRNDSASLDAFFREEREPACSKDGHIYFFADTALRGMFRRTGFRVDRCATYGFKRGMRNMGVLPRKKGWKALYRPKENIGDKEDMGIADTVSTGNGRRRSDLYYRYRHATGKLKMIPGLHELGLDFMFHLSPIQPGDT
jgi:SAM-dependent methyltransferase